MAFLGNLRFRIEFIFVGLIFIPISLYICSLVFGLTKLSEIAGYLSVVSLIFIIIFAVTSSVATNKNFYNPGYKKERSINLLNSIREDNKSIILFDCQLGKDATIEYNSQNFFFSIDNKQEIKTKEYLTDLLMQAKNIRLKQRVD